MRKVKKSDYIPIAREEISKRYIIVKQFYSEKQKTSYSLENAFIQIKVHCSHSKCIAAAAAAAVNCY